MVQILVLRQYKEGVTHLKKIVGILLVVVLLSLSFTSFAIANITEGNENEVDKSKSNNQELHELRIKETKEYMKKNNVKQVTEYDLLKDLQKLNMEELKENGYEDTEIEIIKNMDVEKEIRKEIKRRIKLRKKELKNMGYRDEEIEKLKKLTGDEDFEMIIFSLAQVTVYNELRNHYYKVSENTTYFLVDFGWSWDKAPFWLLSDALGIGWNGDFHPNNNLSTSYNYHYKRYRNQSDWADYKLTKEQLSEKEINTCEDKFDLNGFYGVDYWVQEGWGTMALSQTNRMDNAKFSCKYGHNEIGASPTINYPWGVGFSFTSAESVFQPSEIVYSATATVQP